MWCAEGRLAVAIHHLDVSLISRGKGHAVTAAAAYRAGVRLVDERTGEVHDYRRRSGVDDAVILTPAGAEPWTRDRGTLWNRAEMAESRRDAQLGRSWVLALPRELDPVTNQRLGREFFERHLVSRGMVVDLAFHELDGDNPHVHGLSSLRDLDGGRLRAAKEPELERQGVVVGVPRRVGGTDQQVPARGERRARSMRRPSNARGATEGSARSGRLRAGDRAVPTAQ